MNIRGASTLFLLGIGGVCFASPAAQASESPPSQRTPSRAPASAEPMALPGPPVADNVEVPPGAREDVLLWKQLLDSQNDLGVQRTRAQTLLRRFAVGRCDARLATASEKGAGADRSRLVKARQQLGLAWRDLSGTMSRRWPIDPRLSCRAPFIDLQGAMHGANDPGAAATLREARLASRVCLGKLKGVLDPLARHNRAFEVSLAEAESLLATFGSRGDSGAGGPMPAAGPNAREHPAGDAEGS